MSNIIVYDDSGNKHLFPEDNVLFHTYQEAFK